MKLLICVVVGVALAVPGNTQEIEKLFSQGNAQFTGKFSSEVAKEEKGKSVVMSAFSVLFPLAQLSLAATGESHDELLRTIGLPNDNVTRAVFPLESARLQAIKGIELKLASAVYLPEGYQLNEQFARDSKRIFNSKVQNIDFTKSAAAAHEINNWVEDQTNHRIKNLVQKDVLNDLTRAVLVNAIYFKGSWNTKFNPKLTEERDFHVTSSKTIKVPTMYQKESFKYGESTELDAKLLEMPYVGKEASFLCILPNKIDGLAALQDKLRDPTALDKAVQDMFETEVEVYLPKMKIETTINLKDILKKMGVTKIFDQSDAGLTGLLNTNDKLYVSSAVQKAFIEVNEEGAEAAAANAFLTMSRAYLAKVVRFYFKADRPYFYALKMQEGPIFFSGLYHA